MRLFTATTTFAALLIAGHASADFDVSPAITGNKVVTNAFEDDSGTLVNNVRVFGYEFGEIIDQPYFASDPGFHPQPGTSGFASGSTIGLKLATTLKYWSGTGSPSFVADPTGATLRFGVPGSASAFITTTGSASSSTTLTIDPPIDSSGETDAHIDSDLIASGGSYGSPGAPAVGIYLVGLAVGSSTPGVTASDPVYILFSNGVSEDALSDAMFYARNILAPGSNLATTPEPVTASAAIAAIAGISVLATRRRRA